MFLLIDLVGVIMTKKQIKKSVSDAETFLSLAKTSLRSALNSSSLEREEAYRQEAIMNYAFVETILNEYQGAVPEQLQRFIPEVEKARQIYGPYLERAVKYIKRLEIVTAPLPREDKGDISTRTLNVYEVGYDDDGEEQRLLVFSRSLPYSEGIFSDLPKYVKTLECTLEDQDLSIDIESTIKVNKLDTFDKEKNARANLEQACESKENMFLLQKAYEKHAGESYE